MHKQHERLARLSPRGHGHEFDAIDRDELADQGERLLQVPSGCPAAGRRLRLDTQSSARQPPPVGAWRGHACVMSSAQAWRKPWLPEGGAQHGRAGLAAPADAGQGGR